MPIKPRRWPKKLQVRSVGPLYRRRGWHCNLQLQVVWARAEGKHCRRHGTSHLPAQAREELRESCSAAAAARAPSTWPWRRPSKLNLSSSISLRKLSSTNFNPRRVSGPRRSRSGRSRPLSQARRSCRQPAGPARTLYTHERCIVRMRRLLGLSEARRHEAAAHTASTGC
jgi:hypothetical protein